MENHAEIPVDILAGSEATHSAPIIERLDDNAGDYSEPFAAQARTDVEKLIGGICFLARELSREAAAGDPFASRLIAGGTKGVAIVSVHHAVGIAARRPGAELSDADRDAILSRSLIEAEYSQVHQDRTAALRIYSALSDDLRWLRDRTGALRNRLAGARTAELPSNVVRVITSEAELAGLAADSLVCPAWHEATVHQYGGDGTWVEPGVEDELPTDALWEFLTGSHSDIVMDEDREIWVLFDAACKRRRPDRAPSSPDWLTMANAGRDERFLTHRSLDEARHAIEELCSQEGGAPAALAIRTRPKDDIVYRGHAFIAAGTTTDQLPWTTPSNSKAPSC